MSRILFQKSYIAIIPTYEKTDTHKHPFLHLCFGINECKIIADGEGIQGDILILGSGVKHTVKKDNGCNLILLIDPTSVIAQQLTNKYLREKTMLPYHWGRKNLLTICCCLMIMS